MRIEIRKGLSRAIPVIPLLLDGAKIPDVNSLPDNLKALVRRQAEVIEHRTVDSDVQRLISKLGVNGVPKNNVSSVTLKPAAEGKDKKIEPPADSTSSANFRNGVVKFYNSVRGYGFVTDQVSGEDIFVHVSALERSGVTVLFEGQPITFQAIIDKRSNKLSIYWVRL